MSPNKNHKNTKHKSALPAEAQSFEVKDEPKDPPGVFMPPESEMSPPQLG